MDNSDIKKVNQTLGFVSMTIAWALMNVLNAAYLVLADGVADDSGVTIYWSAIFMAIAWAIFIVYPLSRLNHSGPLFRPQIFPFVSALYAAIVYETIICVLFRSFLLAFAFLSLAMVAGLIFALSYSLLIRYRKLTALLIRRPYVKAVFFLSPAFILFCFLWLLPAIAPSLVFRFMPDAIRDSIVIRTIPRYKAGDNFEPLHRALPGYFNIKNGSGNLAATMENFAFVVQVHCNTIVRLEYAKNPSAIDMTIYSELQNKPCP